MRQLLTLNGESYVKDLLNTSLNFLVPHNIQESLAGYSVPDVYIAFQKEPYSNMLAAINSTITASNSEEKLASAMQQLLSVSHYRC